MTPNDHEAKDKRRLATLSLAALGVVYGDIGTSPLYAIRECFHGEYGIAPVRDNVLGVLSLVFWALALIVSVKYLTFILRADNRGEGGVIALTALLDKAPLSARGRAVFIGLGLFGASLLYGDGMITPAISVLSALEGLEVITPSFTPWVIPATVVILVLLFLLQRRGTGGIGALFGPVTALWLVTIAVLGLRGLVRAPQVLLAVSPWYGARFLASNHLKGFLVLGAVFLVVTGTEALYADMGHFGRRPVRMAWFCFVWPALLCNYFGQGALLLVDPGNAAQPFYALAPRWSVVPLVILATMATIIASQAVISGAFSLTRQAMQLGYLPRMRIVHTSPEQIGQIYVPEINWVLMVATVVLVLGFGSSSRLAAAYGVAVTSTMLISSLLFYVLARRRWGWSRLVAGSLVGMFVVVDLAFFAANVSKILHGAWFPLVIGAVVFILLTTWKRGRTLLGARMLAGSPAIEEFLHGIERDPPHRVAGRAVFMTGNGDAVPTALLHNLKHNRILHSQVVLLTIVTDEESPRVPREEKVVVEDLERGFHRVIGRYGFMEDPNVPHLLALAREQGLDLPLEETSFFLGRERLLSRRRPLMARWRRRLFALMSRNALTATAFFHIPVERVLELGTQVEL